MATIEINRQAGQKHQGTRSQLDVLKQFTRVVADSADFEVLRDYAPEDATTNPSLILKAAKKPEYSELLERVLRDRAQSSGPGQTDTIIRHLLVAFGMELLKIVPGRISAETRAAASFDTQALLTEARQLSTLFEAAGAGRERILIKIASTWEGIQAARVLEQEGIHCNMTLLFNLAQAAACAEAGATLISPFVGRILDWHKKAFGRDYAAAEDPGVASVREIYNYCKYFSYPVEIMGASFRNKGEILELAGCDLLTISPELLRELQESGEPVERKLHPESVTAAQKLVLDEPQFRWLLNQDAMATEKLADGIRQFDKDTVKLANLVNERLGSAPPSAG